MADVLTVLSRSHAKHILAYIGIRDRVRFSDVEQDLDLNPATVDRRLKDLVEADLVEADLGVYAITREGRDALVTLAMVAEDWPSSTVAPDRTALLTVGTLVQAINNLRTAHGSPLHRLLESLPTEQPMETDGGITVDGGEGIGGGPDATEPVYLGLAIQYGLVAVDDNIIDSTRLGDAVLHLLETVPL